MTRRTCELFSTLVMWLSFSPTFAETTTTDVYRQVLVVQAEIELLRLEMGVSQRAVSEIDIKNAQPREVYYQARTLLEKSNRLAFEQLREKITLPPTKYKNIEPNDVLALVTQSLNLLRSVKSYLNIPEQAQALLLDEPKESTDVFKLIVDQNRTLNLLLKSQFAPADVYQRITYAVGITSSILATLPVDSTIGTEPDFVRRMTPLDVYRRLLDLYDTTHSIIRLLGDDCLTIQISERERTDISPSDVYDMASIMIAQLMYLHSITPHVKPLRKDYFPGDKLPSHVFRRAGRLGTQLDLLHQHIKDSSADWLDR